MLRLFAITTVLLTCADHWTTYVCLNAPIDGWTVTEANPVAEWLFSWAGLNAGLAIDSLVTLGAVFFLLTTHAMGRRLKVGLLAAITLSTAYAVINNVDAIGRMGLAPWSEFV
jgi:hypothetical protein